MQALGVGEKALDPNEQPAQHGTQRFRRGGENVVQLVRSRAADIAAARDASLLGTVHVLDAVAAIYGAYFDEVLYSRGPSRDELMQRLAEAPEEPSAAKLG